MPQVSLEFTPELNERINFWSSRDKEKPDIFLKRIISEHIEDLEDYEEAVRISSEVDAGRMKVYSWEEVREHLGLED
ncbi:MAG: hypothetical protein IJP97_03335 [Synergistaceae bacterium]|nr:hypothetical protein [Synergistaceae bacterium]